jgi:hypothetical protein
MKSGIDVSVPRTRGSQEIKALVTDVGQIADSQAKSANKLGRFDGKLESRLAPQVDGNLEGGCRASPQINN